MNALRSQLEVARELKISRQAVAKTEIRALRFLRAWVWLRRTFPARPDEDLDHWLTRVAAEL